MAATQEVERKPRNGEVVELAPEDLLDSPFQPRMDYDEEALEELAASIRANGVINPLTVRRVGEKYEIIGGHRRKRAAIRAKAATVRCVVIEADDEEAEVIALLDNLAREDLQPWEEGGEYARLTKRPMSTGEIARRVGKSEALIRERIEIAEGAGEKLRQAYAEKKVNLNALLYAARLPDRVLATRGCPRCLAVSREEADVCIACGQDLSLTIAMEIGNPQEVAAKRLEGVPTWNAEAITKDIQERYGLTAKPVQCSMGFETHELSETALAVKTRLERMLEQVGRLEGWYVKHRGAMNEYLPDQLRAILQQGTVAARIVDRIMQDAEAALKDGEAT